MARKKKGELPSGNIRKQVYIGKEIVRDEKGNPIIDEKTGKPKTKRKYASVTASGTKEAELAKAELKIELASKKNTSNKASITLYNAIEEYIDSRVSLNRSPTTIQDYRVAQKYAFQDIMYMPMSELTEDILQEAVRQEAMRPCIKKTKNPKPISAKRLKNEWGLISAVAKKYRPDINTAAIELPACVERVVELPPAEKVIDMVKGTDIELAVLIAAWLSFSLSEIRGLTKSKSISADGNYIRINEVIVNVDGKPLVKEMAKNPTRNRKHRIPDYIKGLIDKVDGDYLVPMSGAKLYKKWITLQKQNGIEPITFHDLRHLNASVMALLRIPDKYAQERGGWKTDEVMKKVYTQTFSEEREKVDDTVDSYFNNMVYKNKKTDNVKYKKFLELFELKDNEKSKEYFDMLCRLKDENM
jgi:integrase